MIILREPGALRESLSELRAAGRIVGFVPTMGYLHEGHLSLIRRARKAGDAVVVSVYVNPIQFGPQEDLERYPRDPQRDAALCEREGAVLLFVPDDDTMYPPGFCTRVRVEEVSRGLCGDRRPGHFEGVATVVAKLLCLVQPDRAYFGQKDYQQLVVIRRMVRDLCMGVRIVACPTVREADGLAMSSRNVRLSAGDRALAPGLYRGLERARQAVEAGEDDPDHVVALARQETDRIERLRLEYLEVRDAEDLQAIDRIRKPVVIALAAHLGDVRLIDNVVAHPPADARV